MRVASCAARVAALLFDHRRGTLQQILDERGKALAVALRIAHVDYVVWAFDEAVLTHALREGGKPGRARRRARR